MRTKFKHQSCLQLPTPIGLLELSAIDILDQLPESEQSSQLVVIIIEQYSKLTCAIPTQKILSTPVAHILLNHRIILHGILDF